MNKNHRFTLRNFSSRLRRVKSAQITQFMKLIRRVENLIDFHDMIWPNEVEAIVNTLKACDVKEFTISCRSTNLIDCLVIFEKFNCKMNGLAEVKTGWKCMDGSQETIPALKMRIC